MITVYAWVYSGTGKKANGQRFRLSIQKHQIIQAMPVEVESHDHRKKPKPKGDPSQVFGKQVQIDSDNGGRRVSYLVLPTERGRGRLYPMVEITKRYGKTPTEKNEIVMKLRDNWELIREITDLEAAITIALM